MANDPIQGLIDYVLDVKPYHTKILDVFTNYVHTDEVNVNFDEQLCVEIDLFFPFNTTGSPEVPVQVCEDGWGLIWDRPTPFVVVGAQAGAFPNSVIEIAGDHVELFTPGLVFEVREPSPIGSPDIRETFTYKVDISAYDANNDRTVITIAAGSPSYDYPIVGGSPQEFFLPPYGPNFSNGDVYVLYDILATTAVTGGSPTTHIGYTTPETAVVNKIVIQTTSNEDFLFGRQFTIRNASDPALNRTYNIVTTHPVPSNPSALQLTVTPAIAVTTQTPNGQLVFDSNGWDSDQFCSDIPIGLMQNYMFDVVDFQWEFGSPLAPAFQYFVLEVDQGTDEFTVFGDARDIPVGVGTIDVQSAVSGSPLTLSANNQTYDVLSVTYDPLTNRSIVAVSPNIPDPSPTGWIVPS